MRTRTAAKTSFPLLTTSTSEAATLDSSTFEGKFSNFKSLDCTEDSIYPSFTYSYLFNKPFTNSNLKSNLLNKNVLLLSICLFIATCVPSCIASDATPQFRMDKINFIWQKAQSRLDRQEAAQKLQEELKKFDQLYVSIKHEQQQHHKNTKSVSEADDKLEKLLERYNLDEALNAFRIKYKHDSKKLHNTVNKPTRNTDNFRDVIFSNSRLQQLWSKINQNDEVSKAELSDLHRQFNDLKMKIKEYEKVQEDLEEVDENKVHDTVDHQQLVKEHKALNGEIEDSFQHLNAEIEAVLENPFENERVRKLWIKAKNTPKLIPNELNAIKSELRHLDRHFLQLQHHDDIMDEHKSLHAIEDDPNLASMTDQKDKILHKLTKLETYLNEKLHHTEL